MSEETTFQVNFGRPMPIFPLNSVVLLPHGLTQLHIFEERYRQMVGDALDGSGQIAMAVFEGDRWMQEYHGRPPVRPAVCIGQIIQHRRLPDGRYDILLQGICRARIVEELPPSEDRLYRCAMLEPVGLPVGSDEEADLEPYRERLASLLSTPPLTDLREGPKVVDYLSDERVPTNAVLELIALSVLSDPSFRYRMLEEGEAVRRADLVQRELENLGNLLEIAAPQRTVQWPKGVSWN